MRHAFEIDGVEHEAWLAQAAPLAGDGGWRLHTGDGAYHARLAMHGPHDGTLTIGGRNLPVVVAQQAERLFVHVDGRTWTLRHRHPLDRAAAEAHGHADDEARAPMPGTVVSVSVQPGDRVARGAALMVIESMKLETTIAAARDGTVAQVLVAKGQTFDRDALLATLEPQDGDAGQGARG